MDIPEHLVHRVGENRHVYWIDKGDAALRHGVVRTVRGDVVFVVYTAKEVVAIGVEELIPPPPFHTGRAE